MAREVIAPENCPKKTGEMDATDSCRICRFYLGCLQKLYSALGG